MDAESSAWLYNASILSNLVGTGLVALLAGSVGLVGIQKKRLGHLSFFRKLKVVQLAVVLMSNLIVIFNLDDISWGVTQDIIDTQHPDIDSNTLQIQVRSALLSRAVSSIIFWAAYLVYSLYWATSYITSLKAGIDLDQRQVVLTVPEHSNILPAPRAQLVSSGSEFPLLHGQQASIPTSVQ